MRSGTFAVWSGTVRVASCGMGQSESVISQVLCLIARHRLQTLFRSLSKEETSRPESRGFVDSSR